MGPIKSYILRSAQCTKRRLCGGIVFNQFLLDFELKHSLLNLMTSGLILQDWSKDIPHDHHVVKSSDGNSSSSDIAKLTHAVNQQTSAVTTAMTAILKQFQATPPPASVKAVEEIYVTCGGAHPYYQCLIADGNTFSELWDNIQGYVSATAVRIYPSYSPNDLELAKREICTPVRIEEIVFVGGKCIFLLILSSLIFEAILMFPSYGRPFLWSTRALIEVMERYYSPTTSSSPSLPISEISDYFLEEFADELAHITFLPGNDDLPFDAESDL
ncbi:hypothetical protein Tco_1116168 [Tanacetum coccineum]